MIGGFIVQGPAGAAKKVLLRALGPSLTQHGVAGALPDPVIAVYDSKGSSVGHNHNWKGAQRAEIEATGLAPSADEEAAVIVTVPAGAYTALVYGPADSAGVVLLEAYDLDPSAPARLANLSTRGYVDTGDRAMIGGFIVQGDRARRVLVRGIGRDSLDLKLALYDGNGTKLRSNNNWRRGGQEAAIEATGLQPENDMDAALIRTVPPGAYTTVLSGVRGATGLGLIELYALE